VTLTPLVHGPVALAEGQVIEDRRCTVDPYNPGRTFYLSLLLLYCGGYESSGGGAVERIPGGDRDWWLSQLIVFLLN